MAPLKKCRTFLLLFTLMVICLFPGSVAARQFGSNMQNIGFSGKDIASTMKLFNKLNYNPNFYISALGDDIYPVNEDISWEKPVREVLGFYTEDEPGLPGSRSTTHDNASLITSIAPFYYRVSQGNDSTLELMPGLDAATVRQTIAEAHQKQIKVLALVHNLLYGNIGSGKDLARKILKDQESRQLFVEDLHRTVRDNNYDGVNIDIENIHAEDKDLFTALIGQLSQMTRAEGYLLTVSLPAKTGEVTTGNSWAKSFDYQAIGLLADQIVIMTYDEHGAYGGPGPIASIGWVEKAIQYTLTQVPPEKVMLGIAAYGFDWEAGRDWARYLSFPMALKRAQFNGVPLDWDTHGQVPYYTYTGSDGAQHEVWFENKDSLSGKLDLVNKYDLRGIAIWRLGMEDPGYWPVIADKFTVRGLD